MKKHQKLKVIFTLMAVLILALTTPAFAITEAEVEAQVSAAGKESVTGNVLIWFLCAVGFLKVSQKIDSFMASLGINVGHTGGSMLAEAMLATKGVATIAGAAGHALGGVGSHHGGTSSGGAAKTAGFFKGGLVGMASRKVTSDAVKNATSSTTAVHTVRSANSNTDTHTTSAHHQDSTTIQASQSSAEVHSVGTSQVETGTVIHSEQISEHSGKATSTFSKATTQAVHSDSSVETRSTHFHTSANTATPHMPSLGGLLYARSIASGGSFANDVIGKVAQGDIRSTGSMTGERASQALMSYMGHTALGETAQNIPSYSDVEIGGGRITGIETVPGQSEGITFGMYHADQYAKPQGDFTTVYSADGAKWYKQYAQDTVSRQPYTAPDNTVAYKENIIKKLPDPPKRKDRM